MASVQAHALAKWTPVVAAQILCSRDSARGPCHRQALAACLICREAVCLEHAVIAPNADVACTRCMHDMVTRALGTETEDDGPVASPSPHAAPPPGPEPEPVHPLEERRLRALHLRIMGLPEGAAEEALKKAHRKLSAKWHPDRYVTPRDKETALDQYKRIQVAHDWLTRFGTRSRAA